ncbi:UTP--glucose-1-phosphate uridylyltransferase [Parvularcula bermudensis HTCC2503]|uniref:UTP--glucose-1-phosphate uridylyltransferase n=2 Tax=Parvularcula TaxID=208215 RepID=E0TBU5_PARBH|nr:UTP--glucose-1-phosphate uridylyltransferase [Parvularcula bermudensis HTCC2503]
MLPATKAVAKELLTVVDRPLIHYIADEAKEAGIEHLVFVTGRGKGAIEDYFDHAVELEQALEAKKKTAILEDTMSSLLAPGASSFTRQQAPKGLGHAIWCARDIVGDEPFAILLPDVIVQGPRGCLAQMVDQYEDGRNLVAVEAVPEDLVHKYGIVAPKGEIDGALFEMEGMVEKPEASAAPSNMSIMGRYILQPEVFSILEKTGKGAGGEIQLTDAMATLMDQQPFFAFQYEGESHDCGSKLGFLKANIAYALENDELGADLKSWVSDRIA